MLNKVKTKALISIGAVAATSFILMMGYTAGQHSTVKQSRKEIELAAAKLVEDRQGEDKASILSSDTVISTPNSRENSSDSLSNGCCFGRTQSSKSLEIRLGRGQR